MLFSDVVVGDHANGVRAEGKTSNSIGLGILPHDFSRNLIRQVKNHDVGFHRIHAGDACVGCGGGSDAPCGLVIAGHAVNVVVERVKTSSGENAHLPHASSKNFAAAVGLPDEVALTDEHRPHWTTQTL